LAALIVALPSARAYTAPDAETTATAESVVLHCSARPPTAVPPASRGVPTNWSELPMVSRAALGDTSTKSIGDGLTAITAVALLESTSQMASALPARRPSTDPLDESATTLVSDAVQDFAAVTT